MLNEYMRPDENSMAKRFSTYFLLYIELNWGKMNNLDKDQARMCVWAPLLWSNYTGNKLKKLQKDLIEIRFIEAVSSKPKMKFFQEIERKKNEQLAQNTANIQLGFRKIIHFFNLMYLFLKSK